ALGGLPAEVPFRAGAALVSPRTPAGVALHERGGVRPGERVLAAGAGGAVGSIVCQLARAAGAGVIGVVGTATRLAQLDDGVRGVVVARGEARAPDGLQADLLIDTVGGATLAALLPAVVAGGRAVLVGYPGGSRPALELTAVTPRDVA